MNKIFELFTFKNISEIFKKAYKKYKMANSSFWVTSLSFYTILALVPIFAILLSLGSWFGSKDFFIEKINSFSILKRESINLILTFTQNLLNNARGGVLAGLGFVFLGWTFIKMFSLIENSFNDIWHVKNSRSLIRKISDYISFFIFLPLILILLNGLSIYITNKFSDISVVYIFISKGVSIFSLIFLIASLYIVMPNTYVKPFFAIISAIITSILFLIFQYIFVSIQSVINTYNLIYGSFSTIFIFLLWIRITWFLIILGVHFLYFLQNTNADIDIDDTDFVNVSFESKLYITLKVVEEIVRRYKANLSPPTIDDLRKIIFTSPFLIENVLEDLIKSEYIIKASNSNEEDIFYIVKNLETTTLKEIYNVISKSGVEIYRLKDSNSDAIEEIIANNDYSKTLKNLGGNSEIRKDN